MSSSTPMRVHLRGVGVHNKGAELMAHAVLQHYSGAPLDFVVPAAFGPYEARATLGLRTLVTSTRLNRTRAIQALMSPAFRDAYGLALAEDLDAVLDASGFMFSDQWGVEPMQRFVDELKEWKRGARPVILLPQAFGPFERAGSPEAIRALFDYVDFAFARDEQSRQHLERAGVPMDRVGVAPDFTNLVEAPPPPGYASGSQDGFVVPNMRMLDMTATEERDAYVPFLATAIEVLAEHDLRPVVLLHAAKDHTLVDRIRAHTSVSFVTVEEPSPLRLKGIIGTGRILIGSRFHALVSALAQAVPAIGTSWSHKYAELFADYACPDALLSASATESELRERITAMLRPDAYDAHVAVLRERGGELRSATRAMWARVDSMLGVHGFEKQEATSKTLAHA